MSACSALAFASAFWASDGPMAPVSVVGATSMTQAWRVSGVVASTVSRASMSCGVTVTPSWAASFAWSFASISRSSVIVGSCWRC